MRHASIILLTLCVGACGPARAAQSPEPAPAAPADAPAAQDAAPAGTPAGAAAPPSTSTSTSAPVAPKPVLAPEEVGAYALGDSVRYPQPELGTLYRYAGTGPLLPDVYIYPRSEESTAESEAATFAEVLEYNRQRGEITGYSILSGHPWTPVGGADGYEVTVDLLVRLERRDSWFYVFQVEDRFVKVRMTTGRGEVPLHEVRGFVIELLEAMLDPSAEPQDPGHPDA